MFFIKYSQWKEQPCKIFQKMRMSEKSCNNNNNSDNPLTSFRTDEGKNIFAQKKQICNIIVVRTNFINVFTPIILLVNVFWLSFYTPWFLTFPSYSKPLFIIERVHCWQLASTTTRTESFYLRLFSQAQF